MWGFIFDKKTNPLIEWADKKQGDDGLLEQPTIPTTNRACRKRDPATVYTAWQGYHIFNKIAIGWAMKQVNCRSCGRLLAKIGNFNDLEIKCPRCKAFNVLSVKNALSEVLRDSSTGNLDEQSTSQSTPTICGAKTNVFKRISQNFG